MEDGVNVARLEIGDQAAGSFCRQRDDLDVPAGGLFVDLGHDRQETVRPGADDQARAAPWDRLLRRQRGMAEPIAVGLRGFLVAPADLAAFDDDVGVVPPSLELDISEAQQSRLHRTPRRRPW